MEKEEEGHLPFLDIDLYRKTDGSLGHKVFRKPTHTNLYLYQNSQHHHPAINQSFNQSSLPWFTEPKPFVPKMLSPRTAIPSHSLQGQWIQPATDWTNLKQFLETCATQAERKETAT
jgi:hypothetical protein